MHAQLTIGVQRVETAGLNERGSGESNSAEAAQPSEQDLFLDRIHQWGEEAEKRNRGALEVFFGTAGEHLCISSATYGGLTNEEYRSGKHKMALSPEPYHRALSAMFAIGHDKMENFLQEFDLEADPDYAGMIPGTVTLDGYMHECNRFEGIIAAQPLSATSNINPQKCKTCLELCLDDDPVCKMLKASLKDVETSAKQGCPSCTALRDGIALCEPDFPVKDTATEAIPKVTDSYAMLQRQGYSIGHTKTAFGDNERVINAAYGRGCGLCLTYVYRNGPRDRFGTAVDLDFFIKKEAIACPWKSIRVATEISGDTSSEQSFSRTVAWIEKCHQDHKTCSKLITGPLPDRVLDLCTIDIESRTPVKLVETKNEEAKFVCLSYCWGKIQNLTTTTATFKDHKDGIQWGKLPQTFQDAIAFTRQLRIRYLWIDSLCIVQDDKKDWEQQASKMPSIYENSYVTLAATASDSSAGGCFHKADPKYTARELKVVDRDGQTHEILVRQHLPHWLNADSRCPALGHQEYPILDRGWILQERFLAPRVIHFGRHELMWECMEGAACECSFLDQVENEHLDKLLHHRNMAPKSKEAIEGQAARQILHNTSAAQRWRAMVTRYSRLSLTKENDIFPALSGLAKQMNREIKDTYVAGLWKKNLPTDLLWEVSLALKNERPGPWKAPTWSWAHRKVPVHWVDDLTNVCEPEIHLEVWDAKKVPVGENDMGEISSACLVVFARLCPVVLVVYTPERGARDPSADQKMDGTYLNTLPEPSATLYSLPMEIKLDSFLQPTTQYRDRNDTWAEKFGREVFCMRVATLSSKEYSLIIWLNREKNAHERLGIISQRVGFSSERDIGRGRIPWYDNKKCFNQNVTLV